MNKPNVVYILADDMGYGDFSKFNNGINSTKAIDNLVNSGMTLTNCYSSSPVCAPARASIMTGRYPHKTGVIDTLEYRGTDRLKSDEITIGDVFKNNGYNTALIGKWHLGCLDNKYHPNNRGFEYFYGFTGGWSDFYSYDTLQENGKKIECDGTYITDVFTDKAVSYIKTHTEKPFYMQVAYNAPHFPFQAPDEIIDKYRQTGLYTEAVSTIYAMIEVMDNGIQKIIDSLKETGLYENTIIIFTSDNGPELWGEGENNTNRFNCNLRGYKNLVWEGGIKVPAVIVWEKHIEANTVSDNLISHMDWFPTLLNMCDVEHTSPKKIDGRDVSKTFLGEQMHDVDLFWQWSRYHPILEGNAAVRSNGYKLINPAIEEWHIKCLPLDTALDDDVKAHPEKYPTVLDLETPVLRIPEKIDTQVFNLIEDPYEEHNLVNTEKEVTKQLQTKLQNWFSEVEKERLQ